MVAVPQFEVPAPAGASCTIEITDEQRRGQGKLLTVVCGLTPHSATEAREHLQVMVPYDCIR